MVEYSRRTLVLVGVVGLALGMAAGLFLGWWVWPVQWTQTSLKDLEPQYKNEYIAMVSAAYARDGNLDRALRRLDHLEAGNPAQLVLSLSEQYIADGRSPEEISYVAALAQDLGLRSPQLMAYLATDTPSPTVTLTRTPTPVPTVTLTWTPIPPTLTFTPVPPTATPVPPTAVPTDTPIPAPPTNTPPPAPPTATPVPPTPEPPPQPAEPFVIQSLRLRPIGQDAQHCASGDHYILAIVTDAAGNPLNGVRIKEVFTKQIVPTGSQGKGDGRVQFDIYKDGGGQLVVVDEAGNAISAQTRGMPSNLPDFDLLNAAGYCGCKPFPDDASCRAAWEQRDFRYFAMSHYVYEVVFQRTW